MAFPKRADVGALSNVLKFPTKDAIKGFSAKALERIAKDDLLPTPQAYEILYVYYSGENAGVTRAIDILDKKKTKLTQELCSNIYREYLSEERANQKIREAGDQMQTTIGEVSNVVGGVRSATSEYGENINNLRSSLNVEMSLEDIENVVSSIQNGTNDMMEKNLELEKELTRSAQIMSELRKDLENVRKEAMTDSLTGLNNRKSFDEQIEDIHKYAVNDKKIFSLVMLDIDHFKSFNDDFGHQVGDQVLRLVARTIKNGVKGRDIPCRYGGEEFAIIFPETEAINAQLIANQLREAVANKDIVNRSTGEKMARITFSAGVSEFDGEETVENMVLRADRALYAAKEAGRNQVIIADKEIEENFKA